MSTPPLTVRARQRDPEFVAEGDEALLHLDALRSGLSVATSGAKRCGHALCRGLLEKSFVDCRWRADEEHVGGAVGHVVDRTEHVEPEDLARLPADRIDGALVPARKQVVQGDEPKLAGVVRHAGDDDALRVEERTEIRHVALLDLQQGVDGDRFPVDEDQRVEVGRAEARLFGADTGQGDESLDDGGPVGLRLTAEFAEQTLGGEIVEHLRCVDLGDRGESEADVADRLGEDPADADHDGHAELGIVVEAGDQLAIAVDHRGDEDLDLTVLGNGLAEEFVARCCEGVGVGDAKSNEAALGLVGDGSSTQFRHDREGHAGVGFDGGQNLGGGGSGHERGYGNAVPTDNPPGLGFGEDAHAEGCTTCAPCTGQTTWNAGGSIDG